MILIVGQNPKTEEQREQPFYRSSSLRVLSKWLVNLGLSVSDYEMINASNVVTSGLPKISDMNVALVKAKRYDKVIALGNYASKVLTKLDVPHFKLPHPSGLNRKLNDLDSVNELVTQCRSWLSDID